MTALLADIGGTNLRAARLEAGRLGAPLRLAVADYASAEAALAAALERLGGSPEVAALAVAGPVAGSRARLTNGAWQFDAEVLAAKLGLERVLLVNDFAAQAWALPHYRADDLVKLGGGAGEADSAMAVVGPGTGLGVAGWLPPGLALMTEGGHASLAANDAREAAVIARLRARYGHVSAERVLSGPGLVALYAALAEVDGRLAPPRGEPGEIVEAALDGGCAASAACLEAFFALLGGFAGDVALMLGARGGVYLAGGILPRLAEPLAASTCRARFEAKGRFSDYLAAIPLYLVRHPEPGLAGLAALVAAEGGES